MIHLLPNFRCGPISKQTIYGTDKAYATPYLTRLRVGRFSVHVFHRGDADPDPHDHEEDFWTFPLVSYWEHVSEPGQPLMRLQLVHAWRLHYRPAEYRHRVLGPGKRRRGKSIVTFVWRAAKRREWGFWVRGPGVRRDTFIPWRDYIYERRRA